MKKYLTIIIVITSIIFMSSCGSHKVEKTIDNAVDVIEEAMLLGSVNSSKECEKIAIKDSQDACILLLDEKNLIEYTDIDIIILSTEEIEIKDVYDEKNNYYEITYYLTYEENNETLTETNNIIVGFRIDENYKIDFNEIYLN